MSVLHKPRVQFKATNATVGVTFHGYPIIFFWQERFRPKGFECNKEQAVNLFKLIESTANKKGRCFQNLRRISNLCFLSSRNLLDKGILHEIVSAEFYFLLHRVKPIKSIFLITYWLN